MSYYLTNKTGTKDNDLQMIDTAVRLGSEGFEAKIPFRIFKVQDDPFRIWDFGPRKNVRIKVDGEYCHRAPQDGDWYVRFEDGTFRIMSDEAYGRYLYMLEAKIKSITNQI